MDSFVIEILSAWNMSHLIESFQENEIGEDHFQSLTDNDLKDLIPKLGQRKRFLQKYEEFKNDLALNKALQEEVLIDDVSDTKEGSLEGLVLSDHSIQYNNTTKYEQHTPTSTLPMNSYEMVNNYIWDILNTTDEGKMILKSSKSNFKRNDLARMVVKYELSNSATKSITTAKFVEMAKLIVAIFPFETESIYYLPYHKAENGSVVSARGKLWSAYRTCRNKYRVYGMTPEQSNSVDVDPPVEEVEENNGDLLLWLREATEPFPEVQKAWTKTFNSRKAEKSALSIEQTIKRYKCLSHPLGYLLLQDDFQIMFKNIAVSCLVNKFSLLHASIIELAKSRNKNSFIKDCIRQFEENYPNANENAMMIFALRLIPLLVGCSVIKFKNRTNWKPTRIETQNGFLLCVDTVANLECHLEMLSRLYAKHNLNIQPLPVIVGNWQNPTCYIVLNDVRYLVESPLVAFDIAFKIIYAMDASFPSEAQSSWVFVQEGLYNISNEKKESKGKYYTSVKALLADLKLT